MVNKPTIAIDVDRVLGPHISAILSSTKPLDGAVQGINRLSKKYRLVIVTARHPFLKRRTIKWLNYNFPSVFEKIIFVSYRTYFQPYEKKSVICEKIGAKILLDDKMHNAIDCSNNGIKVYLFGNYNWRLNEVLPKNIIRTKDWAKVVEELL
jgi:uncharacterized HAD superfamily protein